jgi:hypothetical protein
MLCCAGAPPTLWIRRARKYSSAPCSRFGGAPAEIVRQGTTPVARRDLTDGGYDYVAAVAAWKCFDREPGF